ncbi:MAG: TolB family protein [Vicinamibacterales bacterium]
MDVRHAGHPDGGTVPTGCRGLATPYTEGVARFSPDSRWIAYQSNESGRFEVYAKALPGGDRIQISTEGGLNPIWMPSGEILFRADSQELAECLLSYR